MSAPVAALLALLLTAPSVPAKGSKLEQGQRLYNQGELEAALKMLDTAVLETNEPATLEKAHLLRAQCLAARQDFVHAEEAFALALEANPDAALDPAKVDPTLVKMLDSVRNRLTGTLVINSTPSAASVFLDGKNAGETPQTLQVPIGKHRLEVRWGDGPMTAADLMLKPRREIRMEWVQGAPAVGTMPNIPEEDPRRKVRPTFEARATAEAASAPMVPLAGAFDLGGGFEFSFFRVQVDVRVGSYFGLQPRGTFFIPVLEHTRYLEEVSPFIELSWPLWFRGNGVAAGLSGGIGVDLMLTRWFGFFVFGGGEHLFSNPGHTNDDNLFLISGGLRLRVP